MTAPGWPDARTELVSTPDGVPLEYLRTGYGEPVTVFAHGLGNSIADTRPLASGVPGTKIFFQFRGHGRSGAAGAVGYADLAADLDVIAGAFGAGRAVGASLGAAALCALVARRPGRFARLVFFLPAVLDAPGPLRPLAGRDAADEVPAGLRDMAEARAFVRRRTAWLDRYPLAPGLAALLDQVPVPDPAVLAAVRAPALVIGCAGDERHPVAVAERLAGTLGNATLHVYPEPGVLWTARADLRKRLSTFLAG